MIHSSHDTAIGISNRPHHILCLIFKDLENFTEILYFKRSRCLLVSMIHRSSSTGIRSLATHKHFLRCSHLQITGILICLLYICSICSYLGYYPKEKESVIPTHQSDTLPALNSQRPPFIQSIHILGERNSGTTWMYEYVSCHMFDHSSPNL